jgi:hypothetical protein
MAIRKLLCNLLPVNNLINNHETNQMAAFGGSRFGANRLYLCK